MRPESEKREAALKANDKIQKIAEYEKDVDMDDSGYAEEEDMEEAENATEKLPQQHPQQQPQQQPQEPQPGSSKMDVVIAVCGLCRMSLFPLNDEDDKLCNCRPGLSCGLFWQSDGGRPGVVETSARYRAGSKCFEAKAKTKAKEEEEGAGAKMQIHLPDITLNFSPK